MNIAVIGANGQLGADICEAFSKNKDDVFELNHDKFEITDLNSVRGNLVNIRPQIIVNTAAMLPAEKCMAAPLQSFDINALGARNTAIIAAEIDSVLFQISTDYVFDGNKYTPYIETDMPMPVNVYGNSKLSGEYFVSSITRKHFIVRVSGLYGTHPCRGKNGINFVNLMLKLAKERDEVRVVNDEIVSPTCTKDIAKQIVAMSSLTDYGIFHIASHGSCSWYQFAAKIFELANVKVKLSIADPKEFIGKTPRPKYSALGNNRLQSLNLDIMPTWEEGLKKYLATIGQLKSNP
jgi:dTDP-4-dehydrorhamnose reductase